MGGGGVWVGDDVGDFVCAIFFFLFDNGFVDDEMSAEESPFSSMNTPLGFSSPEAIDTNGHKWRCKRAARVKSTNIQGVRKDVLKEGADGGTPEGGAGETARRGRETTSLGFTSSCDLREHQTSSTEVKEVPCG